MRQEKPFLLSTIDNPFSPFTEWYAWYYQDLLLGYDTCGLIARVSNSSNTINDDSEYIAMRSIITNNFSGKHIAVVREDYNNVVERVD